MVLAKFGQRWPLPTRFGLRVAGFGRASQNLALTQVAIIVNENKIKKITDDGLGVARFGHLIVVGDFF